MATSSSCSAPCKRLPVPERRRASVAGKSSSPACGQSGYKFSPSQSFCFAAVLDTGPHGIGGRDPPYHSESLRLEKHFQFGCHTRVFKRDEVKLSDSSAQTCFSWLLPSQCSFSSSLALLLVWHQCSLRPQLAGAILGSTLASPSDSCFFLGPVALTSPTLMS
jgi:hypothetical protein